MTRSPLLALLVAVSACMVGSEDEGLEGVDDNGGSVERLDDSTETLIGGVRADNTPLQTAAAITGCTSTISVPSRIWSGTGDRGHWALTGKATTTCSTKHDFLLRVHLQRWNGASWVELDSRATEVYGTKSAVFNPLMGCPVSGQNKWRYRYMAQDMTTSATIWVNSAAATIWC